MLIKSFFWGGHRHQSFQESRHLLRAYVGGVTLLATLFIQVGIAAWYNQWQGHFFDVVAIEYFGTGDAWPLWMSLSELGTLVACEIVLYSFVKVLRKMWALWWREAMTGVLIPRWESSASRTEGASQRLQEDAMMFAELVEHIGMDFVKSLFTIIVFVPILWGLGEKLVIGPFAWEGTIVVIAVLASIGGMVVSVLVGWTLPGLEYNNQRAEAHFRKQLVYAEEDRRQLRAGEPWHARFATVLASHRRLYWHYGYFEAWKIFFNKGMMILPIAICVPNIAAGMISIGIMMQIRHAFSEVQDKLTFLLDSWTMVTKLMSVWKRLREFVSELHEPEEPEAEGATNVVLLPTDPLIVAGADVDFAATRRSTAAC